MLLILVAAMYGLAMVWAGAGVLGIRMFWFGAIGRRDGTHPHCRACGQDLFGTASPCCPECGRMIAGAKAIVRGTRRRDDQQAALGAALLALLALVASSIAAIPA